MRAIVITSPGSPGVLQVEHRAIPDVGAGDVLIRVSAAGVNRPDIMQRLGKYPPPPGASDLPGLEVAGVIERVGTGVARWRVGDSVCALVAGGGYAEYCVAPAPQCLPIPDGMDHVKAAAVPETFFTVWANLFQRRGPRRAFSQRGGVERRGPRRAFSQRGGVEGGGVEGGLRGGERVLVHGGTSGIGTTAIQLARAFGAVPFATAGSDAKCAACERLGATAINYRTTDFADAIKELTGGRGVDVILDIIGADYLVRNIECLATDGRLVQIGLQSGASATINLRTVMQRRVTLTGSMLRPRSVEEKGAIARDLEERVWPLLASGQVSPVIHDLFPFDRAADAHRALESGEVIGKVVLTM